MAQVAYVNGSYVAHAQASVHIEDRGYQFSDGIYEYIAFYNGRLLDGGPHLARLSRSLKELGIPMPVAPEAFPLIIRELIARNGRAHGGLYIQVTRGVARRDHAFPKKKVRPSLVMTVCAAKFPKPEEVTGGVAVITQPDLRWARRDIKSISLLPNILAKQEAAARKAREAWLVEKDGHISEGAVSNTFIVNKGALITHPADERILGGITRDAVLKLARKAGIEVKERPFTLKEAYGAQEAFNTSTSINVLPVVSIDGKKIGSGKPGPVTRKLQALYAAYVARQTGYDPLAPGSRAA